MLDDVTVSPTKAWTNLIPTESTDEFYLPLYKFIFGPGSKNGCRGVAKRKMYSICFDISVWVCGFYVTFYNSEKRLVGDCFSLEMLVCN